jgi:serine/threonine protein kinase
VLVDFGSARPMGSLQPAGALIGSPGYAAPELEDGAPLSPSMDLYGIGTVLYEALCGDPAFEPEVPAVERHSPKPLDDSETAALALQLLDPDPNRRPELDDAVRELARICADGGMAFRPDWAR